MYCFSQKATVTHIQDLVECYPLVCTGFILKNTDWKLYIESPFCLQFFYQNLDYYVFSSFKTFFLLVCNICSKHRMTSISSCLSIGMLLDKDGNNSWYSLRICFCRFAKLNVRASWVCHWQQYIQYALYETWALGQIDVYLFVQYVKKKMQRVKYLHYYCI